MYVTLRVFKLWRRPRYQIIAETKLYNLGAPLQCVACNLAELYGTEHRVLMRPNLFYGARRFFVHNLCNFCQIRHAPPNASTKTTHQNAKKQLKNIRADLSAAVVGALRHDSQRPGHLLLPWALAIDRWSRCRECIVLWPPK